MSMLDFFNDIEKLFGDLIDVNNDGVKAKSNDEVKSCGACEACKSNDGVKVKDSHRRYVTIRYSMDAKDDSVDVIGVDVNNSFELANAIVGTIDGLANMISKSTVIDEQQIRDELVDVVTKLTLKSILKRLVSSDE